MNWNSTILTRPASAIRPVKEKSGEPSEKPALLAVLIMALAEVPSTGRALVMASCEMKSAPKKLIATETIAKMVRPVTTLWKVRVLKIEMPKITSRIITPTIALLVLSCSQLGALEKTLPGKATPSRMAVSCTLCDATMISKPMMVRAEPTSVQLSIQPRKGLIMRDVKT